MWMRQTNFELRLGSGIKGRTYLLFVQGTKELPPDVSRDGYQVFTADATPQGVVEEFQKIVMNSEWGKLETVRKANKLLKFLLDKGVDIALFGFAPDFNSEAKIGEAYRWDISIRLDLGQYSKEEVKEFVVYGLKENGAKDSDIKFKHC